MKGLTKKEQKTALNLLTGKEPKSEDWQTIELMKKPFVQQSIQIIHKRTIDEIRTPNRFNSERETDKSKKEIKELWKKLSHKERRKIVDSKGKGLGNQLHDKYMPVIKDLLKKTPSTQTWECEGCKTKLKLNGNLTEIARKLKRLRKCPKCGLPFKLNKKERKRNKVPTIDKTHTTEPQCYEEGMIGKPDEYST